MHGAGIRAMGRLMDRVLGTIDVQQPDATAEIRKHLDLVAPHCRWTSGTWDESGLRWNAVENIHRHIQKLSNYLIRVYLDRKGQHPMRFFFPDSQDQVDPGFDFVTEERDPYRVRQRDDLYAHEVLDPPPFDGLLVSKAIVDGAPTAAPASTPAPQRHRLYREGARTLLPPRPRPADR